jgi:hypothetical protein
MKNIIILISKRKPEIKHSSLALQFKKINKKIEKLL